MSNKRVRITSFILATLIALLWMLSANCAEAGSAEGVREGASQWLQELNHPENRAEVSRDVAANKSSSAATAQTYNFVATWGACTEDGCFNAPNGVAPAAVMGSSTIHET
ncbi:hypothetical protein [Candidatus Magnetobacterium casense]|uniref:hypothetical protein n=1 Tax=Candidatus Magnetobacterium casense TaxID=1455061 RepID=UPI001C4977FC|nr:hypothetical protein [Candidatus Magnetobacterium casensis]